MSFRAHDCSTATASEMEVEARSLRQMHVSSGKIWNRAPKGVKAVRMKEIFVQGCE